MAMPSMTTLRSGTRSCGARRAGRPPGRDRQPIGEQRHREAEEGEQIGLAEPAEIGGARLLPALADGVLHHPGHGEAREADIGRHVEQADLRGGAGAGDQVAEVLPLLLAAEEGADQPFLLVELGHEGALVVDTGRRGEVAHDDDGVVAPMHAARNGRAANVRDWRRRKAATSGRRGGGPVSPHSTAAVSSASNPA